nr:hypothetical protein TetV2_00124 [Oceanusvirus sp.]
MTTFNRVFAWANAREAPCVIGGRVYSSARYGDELNASSDGLIRIKGTREGVHDVPMLRAFSENGDVLVTYHLGRGDTLPREIGVGKIVAVEEGTSTKREFVVRLDRRFEESEYETATRGDEEGAGCWKKRRFLKNRNLVLERGNLFHSFVSVSRLAQ